MASELPPCTCTTGDYYGLNMLEECGVCEALGVLKLTRAGYQASMEARRSDGVKWAAEWLWKRANDDGRSGAVSVELHGLAQQMRDAFTGEQLEENTNEQD